MKRIALALVLLAGAALTGCGNHASSSAYTNGVAVVSAAQQQVPTAQRRYECAYNGDAYSDCAALLSDGKN